MELYLSPEGVACYATLPHPELLGPFKEEFFFERPEEFRMTLPHLCPHSWQNKDLPNLTSIYYQIFVGITIDLTYYIFYIVKYFIDIYLCNVN